MTKYFNKLVRDNIIDIIITNNDIPVYRTLDEIEYWNSLLEKDKEELEEVKCALTSEEIKEELADKLEVLRAMASYHGFTLDEIIEEADKKKTKKGGFDKRLFLEKTNEKE